MLVVSVFGELTSLTQVSVDEVARLVATFIGAQLFMLPYLLAEVAEERLAVAAHFRVIEILHTSTLIE